MEYEEKLRLFLSNQIVRLNARLVTEPEDMKQQILQARLMMPGHG